MNDAGVPRAAMGLGLAGLLPALATVAALLVWPEMQDGVARIGIAHGAVVASFVGGAWWGLASARAAGEALPRHLVFSTVPGLVAWPALLVAPATGFAVLAMLFAVLLPMDRQLMDRGVAPGWWLALRRPLSLGMAALHAAAMVILLVSQGR